MWDAQRVTEAANFVLYYKTSVIRHPPHTTVEIYRKYILRFPVGRDSAQATNA